MFVYQYNDRYILVIAGNKYYCIETHKPEDFIKMSDDFISNAQ